MAVMPPAGWFPDPNARHRSRYWDGQLWTAWVADENEAFLETGNAIVLRRDRSWYARLRRLRVSVDGVRAGYIFAGETRSFPVEPGRHRIRVGVDWLSSRELEVSVPPDVQLQCRVGFRAFALTLVRPRRALQLDAADAVERRPNPAVFLLGIAAWFVIYAATFFVATRIAG